MNEWMKEQRFEALSNAAGDRSVSGLVRPWPSDDNEGQNPGKLNLTRLKSSHAQGGNKCVMQRWKENGS